MSVQGGNNVNNIEPDEDEMMEIWHEDDAEDEMMTMMMTMGMWQEHEEQNRRDAEVEWLRIEDWLMDVDEDVEEVSLASVPANLPASAPAMIHHHALMGVELQSSGTKLVLRLGLVSMDDFEDQVRNGYGTNVEQVFIRIYEFDGGVLEELSAGLPGPFDGYVLEELATRPGRLGRLISRFSNMNKLQISFLFRNGRNMITAALLRGLEESVSLTTHAVNYSHWYGADDNDRMQDIVAAFQSPALQHLNVVIFDGAPPDVVQEAILKLPKLGSLVISELSRVSVTRFHPIVAVLANGNGTMTLSKLCLYRFNWDDAFGPALASALVHPSCTLRFLWLVPNNITDDHWRSAVSFLRGNTILEYVWYSADEVEPAETTGGISGIMLVETIDQIAENKDSALISLQLQVLNETTMATNYIEAVERLSKNTTLKKLRIDVSGDSSLSIDFDAESYRRLVVAAQRNYGIYACEGAPHRLTGGDGSYRNDLQVIGKLNKAGRRYLKMGPKFKFVAANVLSHKDIRDNVDAIFFHLQENPELWYRN